MFSRLGSISLNETGITRAAHFSHHLETIAFDNDPRRIQQLRMGLDATRQVSPATLIRNTRLKITDYPEELRSVDLYHVCSPTFLDKNNTPDLSLLKKDLATVARTLQPGDAVVIESTLFPGATENICIPILENTSGYRCGNEFNVAYYAQIEPHGSDHPVQMLAGSNPAVTTALENTYESLNKRQIIRAESFKVAEAGKLAELTRRDLNAAYISEMTELFNSLDIDPAALFQAYDQQSKTTYRKDLSQVNDFKKHAHYLAFAGKSANHACELICTARQTNEKRWQRASERIVDLLLRKCPDNGIPRVLIMGVASEANSPRLEHPCAVDLFHHLTQHRLDVDIWDPWVDPVELQERYALSSITSPEAGVYDCTIVTTAHDLFLSMGLEQIHLLGKPDHMLFDTTMELPSCAVDQRL